MHQLKVVLPVHGVPQARAPMELLGVLRMHSALHVLTANTMAILVITVLTVLGVQLHNIDPHAVNLPWVGVRIVIVLQIRINRLDVYTEHHPHVLVVLPTPTAQEG